MKILKNEQVDHIVFGHGIIIDMLDGIITVEFDSQIEKKIFRFPDAFDKYLKCEDKALEEEVLALVQAKRQLDADENERKKLEREKLNNEYKKEKLELAKKKRKTTKSKETKKK